MDSVGLTFHSQYFLQQESEKYRNYGASKTNKMGTLQNYGDMWFSENFITNIISLSNAKDTYPVTYNSGVDNMFVVHKPTYKLCFQKIRVE